MHIIYSLLQLEHYNGIEKYPAEFWLCERQLNVRLNVQCCSITANSILPRKYLWNDVVVVMIRRSTTYNIYIVVVVGEKVMVVVAMMMMVEVVMAMLV